MNRTLRRPMFRMGGSAEGITSGLAPRQGYADPAGMVEKIQSQKYDKYVSVNRFCYITFVTVYF